MPTALIQQSKPSFFITLVEMTDAARRSLAVEPMTCPPDAFRSGEALIVLEPGESFSGRWGISAGQGADA